MWRYNDRTARSFIPVGERLLRRLYNIPYCAHNISIHHVINSYDHILVLEKRCIQYNLEFG